VYLEGFVMLIAVTDEISLYRPAIWLWPSDGCVIPKLTKETSHEMLQLIFFQLSRGSGYHPAFERWATCGLTSFLK
jgi:hypothetical protein